MLYPLSKADTLCDEVFQNPPAEYRATPFWAWNSDLPEEELLRQIEVLKQMGMGGFHMHSRTGMALPYLQETFLKRVRACVEKARRENMLAWLYDEDRWPSGAAGGIVTKDDAYRERRLRFTPEPREEGPRVRLVARYAVRLEDGRLAEYRRLDEGEAAPEGFDAWYAYREILPDDPWFNNQAYVNTLDRAAIRRFIEVTHETYRRAFGADFGGVIPAIFTDEPQFARKATLGFAADQKDVVLPYADDLPDTFRAAYGQDLLAGLPELIWELPDAVSLIRYRYHDHVAERFAEAFADTVGGWCADNGILLTGHMMEEATLHSQTAALGDAMRSYRAFGLPGIDMLCDYHEYNTAKQAQSAAHQYGRPGVLSELYGVTNWDFDFRGHKVQGDWQAALGVTVRVPHLTWVSMQGEAKRDYPASIGYQSPWYPEYAMIEDHHARVTAALTRGRALVRIGVVHPVESYWLYFGPSEQTAARREQLEAQFTDVTNWLLTGALDFDFLSESLLPGQCPKADAPLRVGEMAYDAVLVPGCACLRASTLDRLEAFQAAGGTLVFAGEIPALVDAQPSDRAQRLAKKALCVPMTRGAILSAFEGLREVELRMADGRMADRYLTQLRIDGADRWLFIAQKDNPPNPYVSRADSLRIRLRGEWRAQLYDTLSGEISGLRARLEDGWTTLSREMYGHDSLLLRLSPIAAGMGSGFAAPGSAEGQDATAERRGQPRILREPVPVTLSEPNVYVMEMAEYAFGDGAWQREEEILRIDNAYRGYLGWPKRGTRFAQPWVVPDEATDARLRLRFQIHAECGVERPALALEQAAATRIRLNGVLVPSQVTGYYVDKCIGVVALPPMPAGMNRIELEVPITKRLGAEWAYLLGDFGVWQSGTSRRITAPVRELTYGDWTRQGLPFYGGNVTYHLTAQAHGGALTVRTPQYRGALVAVDVDGKRAGRIAFAPYSLTIPDVAMGQHRLDITVFGSRVNAFGQLHLCDPCEDWFGPDSWRSTGDAWSYEAQIKPMGLMVGPWVE